MSERFWIIGASEGIGASLAQELARGGEKIALSARNSEKLENIRQSLNGEGHLALPADVGRGASLSTAFDQIREAWGEIDTLIYSAGAYTPMNARQMDIGAIETMVDTNLVGAFRAVATVLPTMLEKNAGRIVLIGSVAGYRGLGNAIGYGASKAGINHFAENLRIDLSGTRVRVQLVCPGFVRTRLTDKNRFNMPFLMEPGAAAKAIAFGLRSSKFEIHFPFRLSLFLKAMSVLPASLYFPLLKKFLGR